MKVFEVITKPLRNSTEIIKTVEYVTSQEDTLKSVADYFTNHCEECEKSLLCVKEVLTLTTHIIAAPATVVTASQIPDPSP